MVRLAVHAGARTAKGIADALTAALPSTYISKVRDTSCYSNFTTASTVPKVVLFTDKSKTSALYKSLSLRFKGRLAFAEVSNKASDLIEEHGVTQFPKLVVLDGDKTEEYPGGQFTDPFICTLHYALHCTWPCTDFKACCAGWQQDREVGNSFIHSFVHCIAHGVTQFPKLVVLDGGKTEEHAGGQSTHHSIIHGLAQTPKLVVLHRGVFR